MSNIRSNLLTSAPVLDLHWTWVPKPMYAFHVHLNKSPSHIAQSVQYSEQLGYNNNNNNNNNNNTICHMSIDGFRGWKNLPPSPQNTRIRNRIAWSYVEHLENLTEKNCLLTSAVRNQSSVNTDRIRSCEIKWIPTITHISTNYNITLHLIIIFWNL